MWREISKNGLSCLMGHRVFPMWEGSELGYVPQAVRGGMLGWSWMQNNSIHRIPSQKKITAFQISPTFGVLYNKRCCWFNHGVFKNGVRNVISGSFKCTHFRLSLSICSMNSENLLNLDFKPGITAFNSSSQSPIENKNIQQTFGGFFCWFSFLLIWPAELIQSFTAIRSFRNTGLGGFLAHM